jgi:hypothetical protein
MAPAGLEPFPFMPRSSFKAQCARSPSDSGRGANTVFDLWRNAMTPKFRSLARSGLVALGVIGCLSMPAAAVPASMATSPVTTSNLVLPQDPIFVRQWYRGGHSWNHGGWNGNWNRGWNGNWNRGWHGNWNRGCCGNWNNGWRYRRHWGHYGNYWGNYGNYWGNYGNYWGGNPSVFFSFGVPFGLYDWPGNYYSSPYYYQPRYYAPRYYAPRYYHRSVSSAHARWCYSRYRSYRAWDNTFQPYYGARQQCYSPY